MALTDKLTAIADAIRAKTGKSDSLTLDQMPTEIANITGGGGSSADERVKYVTFMYGATELIKYPVISGDTCRDPVTLGLIDKPTKESTPQYTYEHNGWSLTEGGSASASALTNVTEDRTVYAAFKATLQQYTITYLDSDGVTLLNTETKNYGDMPNYEPTKEGFSFNGWTPSLATVTGNATYTAHWMEKVTFAGGSWEDIVRIVEAGEAKNHFAIGDTKNIEVGDYTIPFMIVGFNHDNLADGSGKAGMSILATELYPAEYTRNTYYPTALGTKVNSYKSSFKDSTLIAAMKQINKKYQVNCGGTTTTEQASYVWTPSAEEMGKNNVSSYTLGVSIGTTYEKFTSATDMRRKVAGTTSYGTYHIRDAKSSGSTSYLFQDPNKSSAYNKYTGSGNYANEGAVPRSLLFGFCI